MGEFKVSNFASNTVEWAARPVRDWLVAVLARPPPASVNHVLVVLTGQFVCPHSLRYTPFWCLTVAAFVALGLVGAVEVFTQASIHA